MISAYEELVNEIKEKGRGEGIEEGREQEAKDLLVRQIKTKWGDVEPNVKERLNNITDIEQLEKIGEKLILCNGVEELFI